MTRIFLCAGFVVAAFAAWNVENAADRVDENSADFSKEAVINAPTEIAPYAECMICLTADQDMKAELRRVLDARETSKRLDEVHGTVSSLVQLKRTMVEALINQKITLWQAVDGFRELQSRWPGFNRHMFESRYPGRSDEERFSRQVMDAVRARVNENPKAIEELVRSFEREAKIKFGPSFQPEQLLGAGL